MIRVDKHNYKIKITLKLPFNRIDHWKRQHKKRFTRTQFTIFINIIIDITSVAITPFIPMVWLERAKRWILYRILGVSGAHYIFGTLAKNAELLIWVNHSPFSLRMLPLLLFCVCEMFHISGNVFGGASEVAGHINYNTIDK